MKSLRVHIPANLDFVQLTTKLPPSIRSFGLDYLAYIVGLIPSTLVRDKHLLEDGEYIPISTEVLKGLIWNGHEYLKYLVKAEVFETDKQYIVGKKSRSYMLCKKYIGETQVYRITNAKLIGKLLRHSKREAEKVRRGLPHLYRWFRPKLLSIDKVEAELLLDAKYAEKLTKKPKSGSKLTAHEIADLSRNSWISGVNRLHKRNYELTYSIDDKGGRLYTVLTNLPRDFRKFVTYDGKPMVHVDIANSQPYFSALLLNPAFWIKLVMSKKQRDRLKDKIGKVGKGTKKLSIPDKLTSLKLNSNLKTQITDKDILCIAYCTYLMFVNMEESESSTEFQRFRDLVSRGELYNFFIGEYSKKKNKTLTKDKAKEVMFTVLFSKNKMVQSFESQSTELFRTVFPNIFDLFGRIKAKEHNMLAILLQNIECQSILHNVCARIGRDHPTIPIFTIHDSIATTVGNEVLVHDIMQDELLLITGLTPKLKTEYWR